MRNAHETVSHQLEALCGQTVQDFEVIVVDNGSTDDSASIVQSFQRRLPGLRLITANDGAGVSFARNRGVQAALAANILLCDSDDVVDRGWVAAMTLGLQQSDIVGGRLDVTALNSQQVRSMAAAPPATALPSAMKYLPYATGANMGFRRTVFDALSGFDEAYVGGHEEVSFAWRAQKAGFSIEFVPDAIVNYRLRGTLKGVMRQRFGYGRSYAQMYSRHQDEPIPRASVRHEVKVIGEFVLNGPSDMASGRGAEWVTGAAWTAGRWYGAVKYRVRPPL